MQNNENEEEGENFKQKDDHPLHVACNENAFEVVRLLLSKGAPIDILNRENKNCLDLAIEKNHRDVIKVLLEREDWQKLFSSNFSSSTEK